MIAMNECFEWIAVNSFHDFINDFLNLKDAKLKRNGIASKKKIMNRFWSKNNFHFEKAPKQKNWKKIEENSSMDWKKSQIIKFNFFSN